MKQSKRSKKETTVACWRTDFRIVDELPDVKVVRTHFLINFGAIALFIIACFVVAQREYTLRGLNESTQLLEQRIQAGQRGNREALSWSKRFVDTARKVEAIQVHYRAPFKHHLFLAELAMVRPADMIFRQIAYIEIPPPPAPRSRGRQQKEVKQVSLPSYKIELRGDVRELHILDQLKTLLVDFPYGNDSYRVEVTESVQPRTDTGIFPFAVEIRLLPSS
jgi:hypothetical protein